MKLRPPAHGTFAMLTLVALASCTSSGSKAGPTEPVTTLHLATAENSDAPYADDVRYYADRVADLTDGAIRLELDFEKIPYSGTSEHDLVGLVRGGEVDLAFVATRTFDLDGISSLQALQAAMLIDSSELASAIATSSLAADLLAGMGDPDLVGLGLVYEELRLPLAIHGAFTRATDFTGLLIRVPPSAMAERIFRTLGARIDHAESHVVATTGEPYAAAETEYALAGDFPSGSTITANLPIFPKFQAIVVNRSSFAGLDDDQQRALEQAAIETAALRTINERRRACRRHVLRARWPRGARSGERAGSRDERS